MSWNEIKYRDWVFSDAEDTLVSGRAATETDLTDAQISADSITVSVKCADAAIRSFLLNDPLVYSHRGTQRGTYYLQSVDRIGPDRYQLYGLSAAGLLTQRSHAGGIYTGQTAEEIIRDICGDIPVMIESVYAKLKLYGWLPYAKPPQSSARDNLAQVLFAMGAYLGTDLNGVLRVEKLWDGTISRLDEDRIYTENASVRYDAAVSVVNVTEHQWVKSDEDVSLFDGTAEEGTLVTFSDPAYGLVGDGVTVRESGANYAILSAGTGTLTGKAYKHLTRIVSQTVNADEVDNEVSVTDKTLVSLTNSVSVAKRLAQYYRSTATISGSVVTVRERPGHVAQIYDPHDKRIVSACIQSLDTTMSATLKSSIKALVGFTPPQPESAEYFDERVILTGSGEWEVPESVTAITAVLIGGAQGGHCGHGGNPATPVTETYSDKIFSSLTENITNKWAQGGKGGKGGDPGSGGKILQATLDVTPSQKISFSCGVGGFGALFNSGDWANTPNTPGTVGSKTTFGNLSSDAGSVSDIGYTDPVTGEVFAPRGEQGIDGGDGAGINPNHGDSNRYVPLQAPAVIDEDGNVWYGGSTLLDSTGIILRSAGNEQSFTGNLSEGYSGGAVTYNCGSGAAAGSNGSSGSSAGTFSLSYVPRSGMPKTSITVTARGSASVPGASATLVPKKPSVYGKGGRGGYGGGGDGATGLSQTYYGGSRGGTLNNYPGSVRSTGSNGAQGGPGGDGCIILYYRKPKPLKSGTLKTSDGRDLLDAIERRMIV